jgi:hypothetical protein
MHEFTIPRTPPSNNDKEFEVGGVKRSIVTIAGKNAVKQEWTELINAELHALDLPRPIPMAGPLHAYVTLRFRVNRSQEWPNYWDFFMKWLGDCLRGGHPNCKAGETLEAYRAEHGPGWILDDKDHLWKPSLAINREKGQPIGTTVRLLYEAAPVHCEVYAAAQ